MLFTDSHCHLDFEEFSSNLPKLLKSCIEKNVHRIVVPAIGPNNWQNVLTLKSSISSVNSCKGMPEILPCLGIHPWFLNGLDCKELNNLEALVESSKSELCAIGEAGIDGKIAEQENNIEQQTMFFEFQLALSVKHNLPIIVHHRKSHQIIVPLLKKYSQSFGVIHAFSGSYQQAKNYLDLGFKLGIGGTITYERAKKTINTVKKLPIDSILLETDAPAMPLSNYQGEVNTPLRVVDVFNVLSLMRSERPEDLSLQLEKNFDDVFTNPNQ